MKIKYLAIFATALVILLSGCGRTDLVDSAGNKYSMKDLQHKYIYINYWADWCEPCYKEITELNKFNAKHAVADALVVGVHADKPDLDTLRPMLDKFKIKYLLSTTDLGAKLKLPHPTVVPVTYVLDQKLHLVATLTGPQTMQSLEAVLPKVM